MTRTTTEPDGLKFISHWIATLMIVMDLVTVLGLSFEYVLPVALALPNVEVVQSLVALGILLFLAFVQLFFLPMIAFMLDFPSEGG